MQNNAMSFYIFLKKVKELNLEILPNGNRYILFLCFLKCNTHIQVCFDITFK
jgi:hypothetical protein